MVKGAGEKEEIRRGVVQNRDPRQQLRGRQGFSSIVLGRGFSCCFVVGRKTKQEQTNVAPGSSSENQVNRSSLDVSVKLFTSLYFDK